MTGDLHLLRFGSGDELTLCVSEALRGQHICEMSGNHGRTVILTGEGSIFTTDPEEPLKALDGQLSHVAFAKNHSVAVTRSGQVYTLGSGAHAQLGHGGTSSCAEPKLVAHISNRVVVQVACGTTHSLALTREGDMFSWGCGPEGQLGLGEGKAHELVFTPRYINGLYGTPVVQIACGTHHSVALTAFKQVYTWGDATCGQLGHGKPLRARCKPTQVVTLLDITRIACGNMHTAALAEDGKLYSWGVALRGPPLGNKMTGLPELLSFSQERPISQVACGGGSTIITDTDGTAWCWPTKQAGIQKVDIPSTQCVSRLATCGDTALLFVNTSITHVSTTCVPLRGSTELILRGAGFFPSDAIVVKFTHESGTQKLFRGTYIELDAGDGSIDRMVRVEAPDFEDDGPGTVMIALSFEDGVGNTFTAQQGAVRYFIEPALIAALPSCAAIETPTEILLRARDPSHFFATDTAHAFFFSKNGTLLASVEARYTTSPEVGMLITTPLMEKPEEATTVRIALDGQTAAPMGAAINMYSTPKCTGLTPGCGPAKGGTVVKVQGSTFFSAKEAVVRLVAEPQPPPDQQQESAASAPEAEDSVEEVATGVEEGEKPQEEKDDAVLPPPPVSQLPEGATWCVPAAYSKGGALSFSLPALPGIGYLSAELAMNGVDFVPIPGNFFVHGQTSIDSLTPSIGSRSGGTVVRVHGQGIAATQELCVCFVKGEWRVEVPASYDAESRCATCVAPPYGGVSKDGPDDSGDCIAELSLNGQQWTWSCKHFTYVADPAISSISPANGTMDGGTPLQIVGTNFRASDYLAVRFLRTALDTNNACSPSMLVKATLNESGAVECATPHFEGADTPFEVTVQLTVDGQTFSEAAEGTVFKFEPVAAKKKK